MFFGVFEILVSHFEEYTYMLCKNIGLHMANKSDCLQKYTHNGPVSMNCVKYIGPNHEYVVGGSDSKYLLIWRKTMVSSYRL